MIKLFYDKAEENIPFVYLLYPNLKLEHKAGGGLWNERIFSFFAGPAVELVSTVAEADFILLPHNYDRVRDNHALLSHYRQLSQTSHKRLIIFAYGDAEQTISIPGAIVFTYQMYSYQHRKNEIKMPPLCEDFTLLTDFYCREKTRNKPSLGFCGRAEYGSFLGQCKVILQTLVFGAKKGIYFRKKIVDFLLNATLILPQFIIRHSYSANKKTIELSPEEARRDFIQNLQGCDFSLDIRGDSNESTRFYEALSLGRIPVVIDTGRVFPFEKEINYNEFILRIPYNRYKETPQIVADFYRTLTPEEFRRKQLRAREVFEKYLRIDAYFKYAFSSPEKLLRLLN